MTVQSRLCQTWSEPKLLIFSRTGSSIKMSRSYLYSIYNPCYTALLALLHSYWRRVSAPFCCSYIYPCNSEISPLWLRHTHFHSRPLFAASLTIHSFDNSLQQIYYTHGEHLLVCPNFIFDMSIEFFYSEQKFYSVKEVYTRVKSRAEKSLWMSFHIDLFV